MLNNNKWLSGTGIIMWSLSRIKICEHVFRSLILTVEIVDTLVRI